MQQFRIELIGYVAAILTTIAFIPQVLKTWREHSTKDISLATFSLFGAGVGMWAIYGFLIGSWPVIIANILTFGLSLVILYFKIKLG